MIVCNICVYVHAYSTCVFIFSGFMIMLIETVQPFHGGFV